MKQIIGLLFSILLAVSCQKPNQSSGNNLLAEQFYASLKAAPDAQLLDVRSPEEFETGHLQNAQNVDWNSSGFNDEVAHLDKEKPVFVYCHAGGRSAEAANQLRNSGFMQVLELKGGLVQWREAGLPTLAGN